MPNQKKKLLPMAILTILREHTDARKHLRQAPIMKLLEEEHQLTATRKSVRKNLGDLQEVGYPIKFSKGWYYEPALTPEELDFLRACVMGSDLRADQRMSLLDRLVSLGGPFYQPGMKGPFAPLSPEFPYVVIKLNDAIAKGRKVTLTMQQKGEEKPEHRKVNPYRLENREGTSVLICRGEEAEEAVAIPVAEIADVRILKPAASPETP